MHAFITNAIKTNQEIIVSLKDGSKISGVPSWGESQRVKIKTQERVVWVPLIDIELVTTLHRLNAKKPPTI